MNPRYAKLDNTQLAALGSAALADFLQAKTQLAEERAQQAEYATPSETKDLNMTLLLLDVTAEMLLRGVYPQHHKHAQNIQAIIDGATEEGLYQFDEPWEVPREANTE